MKVNGATLAMPVMVVLVHMRWMRSQRADIVLSVATRPDVFEPFITFLSVAVFRHFERLVNILLLVFIILVIDLRIDDEGRARLLGTLAQTKILRSRCSRSFACRTSGQLGVASLSARRIGGNIPTKLVRPGIVHAVIRSLASWTGDQVIAPEWGTIDGSSGKSSIVPRFRLL